MSLAEEPALRGPTSCAAVQYRILLDGQVALHAATKHVVGLGLSAGGCVDWHVAVLSGALGIILVTILCSSLVQVYLFSLSRSLTHSLQMLTYCATHSLTHTHSYPTFRPAQELLQAITSPHASQKTL